MSISTSWWPDPPGFYGWQRFLHEFTNRWLVKVHVLWHNSRHAYKGQLDIESIRSWTPPNVDLGLRSGLYIDDFIYSRVPVSRREGSFDTGSSQKKVGGQCRVGTLVGGLLKTGGLITTEDVPTLVVVRRDWDQKENKKGDNNSLVGLFGDRKSLPLSFCSIYSFPCTDNTSSFQCLLRHLYLCIY